MHANSLFCRLMIGGLTVWMGSWAVARDWYVATNATPTEPYASWATGFTNIQDAINVASDGDTLFLAGHTFSITNSIHWIGGSNLTLRGGYAATNAVGPGAHDPERWPTVIRRRNADDYHRVMTLSATTHAVIRDVTIRDGWLRGGDAYGGGMFIENSTNVSMLYCTLSNNRANSGVNNRKEGGGLYVINSSGLIAGSTIASNSADRGGYSGSGSRHSRGGGIYIEGGNVVISNSLIYRNTALENYNRNDITRGGGLYFASGTHVMVNCLVFNNYCDGAFLVPRGGGIYSQADLTIKHSTIAYNLGEGIMMDGGSMVISNSIVWGNANNLAGTPWISYSCIQDAESLAGVDGNISADPLFEYGFYLGAGSPAINAGSRDAGETAVAGLTTRSDGTPDSGTVDMGYHYAGGKNPLISDLYVIAQGTGTQSGVDWDNALPSISAALERARMGSHLYVGAGYYTNGLESFPLSIEHAGIRLLGTHAATTVVDGLQSDSLIRVEQVAPIHIEGLTLTGGYRTGTSQGIALNVYRSPWVAVIDCVIANNQAHGGVNDRKDGVGVYGIDSFLCLKGCLIASNRATRAPGSNHGSGYSRGGGIASIRGGLNLDACIIRDNEALGQFNLSTASAGGGAFLSGGRHHIRNSLITGNRGEGSDLTPRGSGVHLADGWLVLENCTIADNWKEGLRIMASGMMALTNTIVWGHAVDTTNFPTDGNGYFSNVTHSLIGVPDVMHGIQQCLSTDPLFVDPQRYDFRLQRGISPAIDAGINRSWMDAAVDLMGMPRILYGVRSVTVDMGAYETPPVPGSLLQFQ